MAAPPPDRGGLVEWLWRGRALRLAREAELASPTPAILALARELAEVADRLSERIDSPREGSGMASAILLYREALRACRLVPGAAVLLPVDVPVVELDAAAIVGLSEPERLAAAIAARAIVRDALRALLPSLEGRRRALFQRLLRMGALVTVLSCLVGGAAFGVARMRHPPNLLDHATMRPSSVYGGFSPSDLVVDGRKTHLLFHTDKEESPYVEFDLGKARQFTHVALENRHDCCDERAAPLVVEVSPDGKRWTEILRRVEPFSAFAKTVPAVSARFVRVRALRRTWLHLERVAVW